jgi:hydrogenase expression/formation protein HypE
MDKLQIITGDVATNKSSSYKTAERKLPTTHISLAHGNGGRYMRQLISELFLRHLGNQYLDIQADAVTLPVNTHEIVVTTDGFTVQPLEYPGGDIGSLAIHGTVNDLAVAGATPLYLMINTFIEEGLEIRTLERIIKSMARAAQQADVHVVAGDTKVVRHGEGSGLYLASTGIGIKEGQQTLGMAQIKNGDAILVSGPIGDHGVAVMLAREQFGLYGNVQSDEASVLGLTRSLLPLSGLRFMRDPTRGGLATVANEVVRATGLGIQLNEADIPIRDSVRSYCEILGYDPLYLACEGRVVAVVDASSAQQALSEWHRITQGKQAAIIGKVTNASPHVVLGTLLGGERILEELEDDPLPRIC